MSLASSIIKRWTASRTWNRTGRLGVDIGSSAIRVVHLQAHQDSWRIRNRLTVPVEEPVSDLATDLSTGLLERHLLQLKNLPLSRMRHCNCVLPEAVTDLRTVEVPPGSPDDIQMMAREALRDSLNSDLSDRTLRCWVQRISPRDMVQVSGVSVRTELAESVVDQFQACGWKCHQFMNPLGFPFEAFDDLLFFL